MPTTLSPSFVDQLQVRLQEKLTRRTEIRAAMAEVLVAPQAEKRDLNEAEAETFAPLRDELRVLDGEADDEGSIAALEARIGFLKESEKRDAETAAKITSGTARVEVKSEERTYGPASEKRGVSFLRDVIGGTLMGDFQAQQRLQRHMSEERVERAEYMDGIEQRDVGTSAFAGLTVPQYLTDMVAPKVRNKRPFLDICNKHPLPAQGMTVEISRVTTGTTVAVQATQGAAASETDIDDTQLTVNVRTYSGAQDVVRQVIDRTTGGQEIILADLVGAYHEALDSGCINDDGTSGTHLGIANVSGNAAVTYTDASPTAAELHPKLANLLSDMSAGPNGLTHFLYNPRRWYWQLSSLSSTFPLFAFANAGYQQVGQAGDNVGSYDAGGRSLMGPPVVLDRNIITNNGAGTNEDIIYGVDAAECHLWEDANAPLLIRAEGVQSKNLVVQLVVYGYSAFTAGRYPLASGDITGTGLVTPTF